MHNLSAGPAGAEAIVFLHGLGTGASAWKPQVDALSDRYRVVAPHLPGFAGTPGPFTPEGAGGQLAALLQSIGEPVHVCGLSLGALVALDLARHEPGLVQSLILAAGFVAIPAELQQQREQAALALGSMDAAVFEEQVRPGLVRDVPAEHQTVALDEISSLSQADVFGLMSLEFDASDWIDDVTVRALVLCGDRDEVNLPLSRQLAERLPNGVFEVLPEAGHVLNLDAPVEFSDAVLRFLASDE